MGRLILPRNLVAAAEAEGRHGWLVTALPAALGQVLPMWSLTVGEPFQPGGQTAWVAPAWDDSGAGLVLKIAWPHTRMRPMRPTGCGPGPGTALSGCGRRTTSATLPPCSSSGACPVRRYLAGPNPNRTWWSPRCYAGSGSSPTASTPSGPCS